MLCILNCFKATTIDTCKCGNEGKEGEKARQLVIYCDTYCRTAPKIMVHVIFSCMPFRYLQTIVWQVVMIQHWLSSYSYFSTFIFHHYKVYICIISKRK